MTRTSKAHKASNKKITEFRGQLLEWYDQNKRDLPWRAKGGVTPDPYHVWLSEIMLQQTTVTAVQSYFLKFLEKWPTVNDLASAPQTQIMSEWAGLGYYARARNLHKCAIIIAKDLNGIFPQEQAELKKLPGVGDYTSAAIRAIAFNKPATVIDGNIERIMARYYFVEEPLPASKPKLKSLAAEHFTDHEERSGDLAQALMDLGSAICIPKTPRCTICPIAKDCIAGKTDYPAGLPKKTKKKPKPQKIGYVYLIKDEKGAILLQRRPDHGLLGGMLGFPTSEWVDKKSLESLTHIEVKSDKNDCNTSAYHTFTHFDLELKLNRINVNHKDMSEFKNEYFWIKPENLEDEGFPTVFQKVLNIFLYDLG